MIATVGAAAALSILMLMNGNEESISLYFHIPFCTQKCAYCHFYVIPDKDPFKLQLMQGFQREWEHWLPALQGKRVATVYFGGGTPTLIGAPAIVEILSWVRAALPFDSQEPEITIEANPENVTRESMAAYAAAGINRVSIGVQTLDNTILDVLKRIHDAQGAIDAIYVTAEAGIKNISIDLMYDLPGQTLGIWQSTLEQVRVLPITHLSLYNLTIEPHTGFFKQQEKIRRQLPDPEASLKMYEMAISMLEEEGFAQYEISAFAKENRISRHNVGYWTGRPFLGFGPSAFSYWEGRRFRNIANLSRYCTALSQGKSPVDFTEELDPDARRREMLAIELRLKSGVNLSVCEKHYGPLEKVTEETIQHLCQQGFIARSDDDHILRLTQRGILFYDSVAIELI